MIPRSTYSSRAFVFGLRGMLALLLVALLSRDSHAGPATTPTMRGISVHTRIVSLDNLTPAEQWIIQQTGRGEVADLSKQFSTPEQRIVRASVVTALIRQELAEAKVTDQGVRISSAVFAGDMDLSYSLIPFTVWLDKSDFRGDVKCYEADFQKDLTFDHSTFYGGVNFQSCKIAHLCGLHGTTFLACATARGSFTDFTDFSVGGNLDIEDAEFCLDARFDEANVGGAIYLIDSKFHGVARFLYAKSRSVLLQAVTCDKSVKFNSMDVGGGFIITADKPAMSAAKKHSNSFLGDVDISGIKVAGVLDISSSDFQRSFVADGCKCAGIALANNDFSGGLSANFIESGSVSCSGCTFIDCDSQNAVRELYKKSVYLMRARIDHDLTFTQCDFRNAGEFETTAVGGDFRLSLCIFDSGKGTNLKAITAGGNIDLSASTFSAPVYLQGASSKSLLLRCSFREPIAEPSFFLDDAHFEDLTNDGKSNKFDVSIDDVKLLALSNFVDKSVNYDPRVYQETEEIIRRDGDPSLADRVYINGQARLRKLGNLNPWRWFLSYASYLLVGNGRQPWKALIPSVAIILMGWAAFWHKRDMTLQDSKPDPLRPYQALWYSVDLFIPVIGLNAATVWAPRDIRRWRYQWMRVQKILGWLLVPLFVAAWTGIIK